MKHLYLAIVPLVLLTARPGHGQITCMSVRPGATDGKDADLWGTPGYEDLNLGGDPELMASAWTWNSVDGVVRGLIAFDLSFVPEDAVVVSADLSLYATVVEGGFGPHSALDGPNDGWIERVTSPWEEDAVTWNTRPTTTPEHRVSVPGTDDPLLDYPGIDVTELVQDMLIDPGNSHGFALQLQTEVHYRRLGFSSSDNVDAARHPQLEVCWRSTVGVEEHAGNAALHLYPNPAVGEVVIEAPPTDGVGAITVLDAQGRVVRERSFTGPRTVIPVADLAEGAYHVQLVSGGRRYVRPLVVVR